MASKLKQAKPIDFNNIVEQIKDRQHDNAESIIQRALERYVAPFVSSIQFGLVIEDNGGDVVYYVTPLDNIANTNIAGDGVTSAMIVNWLNNGTDVRYAVFPEGYNQGSSPGSLSTSTPSGTEEGIIDRENPELGIVARRFLEQITQENKSLIIRRLQDRMKTIRIN